MCADRIGRDKMPKNRQLNFTVLDQGESARLIFTHENFDFEPEI